jgi:hypothetical protein
MVLGGTDRFHTSWIQENNIHIQYFDEKIYFKVTILKTRQVKQCRHIVRMLIYLLIFILHKTCSSKGKEVWCFVLSCGKLLEFVTDVYWLLTINNSSLYNYLQQCC